MHRSALMVVVVFLFSLMMLGCSGGSGNPVSPSAVQELTGNPGTNLTDVSDRAGQQAPTYLWGYYDIWLDLENRTIEVEVNRTGMFTANIVTFLNASPPNLSFSFNNVLPLPTCVDIDLDVTITHPLNLEKFDGYDVRGIFIGNGSESFVSNTDLIYPAQEVDQQLMNADGYTRWFNPTEFTNSGLFGYTHGIYASKEYTGTATLCPYKYFGDGLGATDNLLPYLISGDPTVGYFLHGTSNTRNYQLRFPMPLPGIKYGYAIIASWAGGQPGDHPAHCPEAVGVVVDDSSTLYYVDETTNGGDLILDIGVFDWDAQLSAGVMEDYLILVEGTVLSTAFQLVPAEMTPTVSGDNWHTYHVEIPADNVTGTVGNELWVMVEDSYADYTNPFGVGNDAGNDPLMACFRFDLEVANEAPLWIEVTSPNGGEMWPSYSDQEITWESSETGGTVNIEYSKDNFVSDVNVIESATPNDGSFVWESVPFDFSDTVRVRVFSADPPMSDTSNDDFSIVEPAPFIDVLIPDGGEEWGAGSSKEISWFSYGVPGDVNINYSNDAFASHTSTVAADIPNTHSYDWELIPYDPTSSARVKIESSLEPAVFGVSDNDFNLIDGGWARTSGDGGYDWANGVAADNSGNVYVTGGGLVSGGNSDSFLCQYNAAGELMWRVSWGGSEWDSGYDVAFYDEWVLVVGMFRGADADFDPDADIDLHSSNGGGDAYLCKYHMSGDFQWAVTWGGSDPSNDDYAYGIALDSGDVYVTGQFYGTNVDFDPDTTGSDLHSSKGGSDAYLSRFGTAGTHQWTGTWGSPDWQEAADVAVDGSGRVFVVGSYEGDVDFDPDPGETYELQATLYSDVFLSWFDGSDDFLGAHSWGGVDYEYGESVAVDGLGNIYVAGEFDGTDVDFDPGSGVDQRSSLGMYDIFLSKFNSLVEYQWAHTWGGSLSDGGYGVAADAFGDVMVVGYFESVDADFDPGPGTEPRSSLGEEDFFWCRFDASGAYVDAHTWGRVFEDEANAVTISNVGSMYVVGEFESYDVEFARTGLPCSDDSYIYSPLGDCDAFLSKYLHDGCW